MAKSKTVQSITSVKKKTSIGNSRLSYGSGMNKKKKANFKKYRGQGK
jgi:hypothetical protein